MYPNVTMRVTRAGVQTYASLAMQLETMSQQQAAYWGGAEPYFRFLGILDGLFDIRPRDLGTDLANTDPETGANKQYRVINTPDDDLFVDGHMELVLDRVRGT
jgi:hypothetical protein